MTKEVSVTDLQCGASAHVYDDGEIVLEIPTRMNDRFLAISRAELARIAALSRGMTTTSAGEKKPVQGPQAKAAAVLSDFAASRDDSFAQAPEVPAMKGVLSGDAEPSNTEPRKQGEEGARVAAPAETKSRVISHATEIAGQYVTFVQRMDDGKYKVIVEGPEPRSGAVLKATRVYKSYDTARRAKVGDAPGQRGRLK